MSKIVDYELEFFPSRGSGIIRFHEEGNPNPIILPRVPLADFTLLSVMFTTGNAYTTSNKSIIVSSRSTGIRKETTRLDANEASFDIPENYK